MVFRNQLCSPKVEKLFNLIELLTYAQIMKNGDLGRTLREIGSKGVRDGFYSGRIADAIVAAVKDLDGVLDIEDLEAHKTLQVNIV